MDLTVGLFKNVSRDLLTRHLGTGDSTILAGLSNREPPSRFWHTSIAVDAKLALPKAKHLDACSIGQMRLDTRALGFTLSSSWTAADALKRSNRALQM